MIRNLLLVVMVVALGTVAMPTAFADTNPISFTFNVDFCGNPCLGGNAALNNGGTVKLTEDGSDGSGGSIVDILVTLASGLIFHDQGLESFAFNITGDPKLTLTTGTLAAGDVKIINAGGSTWTLDQPSGNADGAGDFDYGFECLAGAGHCSGSPTVFEFQVDLAGLTNTSFETTASGIKSGTVVDFGANVANGPCTGMIGAGNGTGASTASTKGNGAVCTSTTTSVPEPTSVLLLGTVLLFVGKFVRGRLAA